VTSRPDVTVVIPTRDRWKLVASAALPAALGQEDVDVEVVVVDDGSSDETPERLAELTDPRLRIIRHPESRGVARARNAGIAAARGTWLAFLDDDDVWSPRKLRLQLDSAEAAGASFVYGGAAAVAEDRSWLYSLAPTDPAVLARTLLSRNVLWGGCSNVVARTQLVREAGGFDEQLFQLADWDLWIRLTHAAPVAACPDVVVGCIVHPGSMLLTSEDDVFEELDYLEDKHRDLSERLGVRVDRRRFTRWVALGHRRAGRRLRAARVYLVEGVRSRDPGSPPRALAALLGERAAGWGRRALRRPIFDEHLAAPTEEPPWLAAYREGRYRTSAQAMRRASSPTES
jgi:glycosyltransferase involved in cell wall biosynthesis